MNTEGKTKGELPAMAEALEEARGRTYVSPVMRARLTRQIKELRAAAEAMQSNNVAAQAVKDSLTPERMWLWRNFVDGRSEYLAFDNPYPCHENGDPMTLGEPVGYAVVKASRNGRPDVDPDQVLRKMQQVQSNNGATAGAVASLKALIAFEVMTALDPAVSSNAAALVEQGRNEERERMADRLAELYANEPGIVARVCDDYLDRSGAMLGRVREIARKQ